MLPSRTSSAARIAAHLREATFVLGGKVATFGSLFLSGLLVARATQPAEYGLYATALSLVLLLDAIIGAPCDLATVRFGTSHQGEPERVDRLMAAAMRIKLLTWTIVALVALAAGPWIAGMLFHDSRRWPLLGIAVAVLLALLCVRQSAAFLQVRARFGAYGALDLLQGVLRLGLVAGLFAWSVQSVGWYLGAYGAGAAAAFVAGGLMIKQHYLRSPWPERQDVTGILRYVGVVAITSVLGSLSARSDLIIVSVLASPQDAGYYAGAHQLTMPLTMLAMYSGIVMQPRLMRLGQAGALRSLLAQTLAVGLLAGIIVAMAGIVLAPWIIDRLFGAAYAPAIPIFRVLVVAGAIDFMGGPILLPLVMQMFPRQAMLAEGVSLALFLVLAVVGVEWAGGVGMAIVVVLLRVIKLGVYLWVVLRHVDSLRLPDAVARSPAASVTEG